MAKSKTPARKPAKPAPKATPKKAPPPTLRPGHKMSERKLAGLRNKKGLVEFLLGLDLIDLVAASGFASLDAYVRERAVPPGYRLDSCVYTPVGVAGKKVQLKVAAKIEPVPEPAPEPEPAPALKIAEPAEFKDTSVEEAEEASRLASEHGGEVLRAQLKAAGKAVRVGVTASVVTRDGKHRAAFEADTWLAQAQDSEILQLARDGYKDTTAADGVAEYMQRVDATVGDVIREGSKNDPVNTGSIVGFEVTIDEDKVLEWVEANRPHLLPGLASIKDGAAPPEEPAATA